MLAELQTAWNKGDIERFTPMLDQMETRSRRSTADVQRPQRPLGAVDRARLQQRRGVRRRRRGPLAGKDSVQHKLGKYGIRTARVN